MRDINKQLSRVKEKHVRVVKIGDKWNTYLQIDHQSFCVVEQTTKKRAEWFGNMLGLAIQRLKSEERKP